MVTPKCHLGKVNGIQVKSTLETSGEDAKTTLETSGEDVKTTLKTSVNSGVNGKSVRIHRPPNHGAPLDHL